MNFKQYLILETNISSEDKDELEKIQQRLRYLKNNHHP